MSSLNRAARRRFAKLDALSGRSQPATRPSPVINRNLILHCPGLDADAPCGNALVASLDWFRDAATFYRKISEAHWSLLGLDFNPLDPVCESCAVARQVEEKVHVCTEACNASSR